MKCAVLSNLLEENRATRDFSVEIRSKYCLGIMEVLKQHFAGTDVDFQFRYGGSLRKGDGIKGSSDIDLLCYATSGCRTSLKAIYHGCYDALTQAGYAVREKNSALSVSARLNDRWDYSVDVVPGKYANGNGDDGDAWLYCRKSEFDSTYQDRLKTNPEKQIKKVTQSNSREVIQLIKVFREAAGLEFKSFFLEIFCIDVVEPFFKEQYGLLDKLIEFCCRVQKIGEQRIYDPANENNDIMGIHSAQEFDDIKRKFKQLLFVLLTNNESAIGAAFRGTLSIDVQKAYVEEALSHINRVDKKGIPVLGNSGSYISVECFSVNKSSQRQTIYSGQSNAKDVSLHFRAIVRGNVEIKSRSWIVSNGGYDAASREEKRGDEVEPNEEGFGRKETTRYYGFHVVVAKVVLKNKTILYSKPFIVRVEFDYCALRQSCAN